MAIGTDAAIYVYGTQDSVDDGTTSSITDTSFSVAADITAWTNDDDAPLADMVLKWQYPSGTISAGASVGVFARLMNIDGTNDESTPDTSNEKHYLGSFKVDEGLAVTTDNYEALNDIKLPSHYTSQVIEFYFKNNTGVTISANWTVKITPKSIAPHA